MKIQVNARNTMYEFEAKPDERILFAGLNQGLGLPYECASGTCGSCKARLVEGSLENLWPESPRAAQLGSDEFLMCQCAARSDLVVDVGVSVQALAADRAAPKVRSATIEERRLLTRDVIELDLSLDEPIDFEAGQFVLMNVPGIDGYRGYSMVNFERGTRKLRFVVKRKPGGALTEWLFTADPRKTAVRLFGPLGRAIFHPDIQRHIVCVAGGSGIAGMMSIVARACDEGYFENFRGHVFFGVRTMEDAFYLDELAAMCRRFPNALSVHVVLSEEEAGVSARCAYPDLHFDRGLVHDAAGRHMKGKFSNTRAYVAGPPPAVDAATRMLLLEARLTPDNICFDKFA